MQNLGVITSARMATLTEYDRKVLEILKDYGIQSDIVIWDENEDFDPKQFDALLFRTCWDYHERYSEFVDFLDKIESCGTVCFNPISTIRANAHKFYLAEMQLAGIQIIPTIFLEKKEDIQLARIMEDMSWERAVVKPAISAGSKDTWIAFFSEVQEDQIKLEKQLKHNDILLQQFMPQIQSLGEFSTVFFANGTHYTVRKTPVNGDFRIQKQFGGLYEKTTLDPKIFEQVQNVYKLVKDEVLLARVDGIITKDGFQLMELELIEPDLYLDVLPEHIPDLAESLRLCLEKA